MNVNAQTIELYAKQLRTPTFNRYEDVLRQLGPDRGYEDFLIALMKMELDSRMESSQRRKIRTAGFPYIKTMDELDFSRFEHINEAFIRELASCDFVSKRQNIVMIGNPGTGKTHLSIALGIKACMQGSVEALRQSLERLNTGEVKVNIIHGGVGAITETDVMFASASNAIIIGFNVRPDVNARKAAESEKVDVRLYRVIYNAIEDVKAAMSGLLEPEYKEVTTGRAEVRQTFKASKIGTIAGCYVLEGKIERGSGVRLVRDGIVVHEGKIDSLKRFKDDVKEVVQGYECGITLEKYNEIKEGDIIEAFAVEAIKRELT